MTAPHTERLTGDAPPAAARLPFAAHAARVLALAIAVAAVVDPAVTRARRGAPVVSVVTADSARHAARVAAAQAALRGSAAVVRGPVHGADVTVVVGDAIPASALAASGPASPAVVLSAQPASGVRVLAASLPPRTSLYAAASVQVTVAAATPTPTRIALTVGDVVVAQDTATATPDGTRRMLAFTPARVGVQRVQLRVRATSASDADVARVDLVTQVDSGAVPVLAWDARPSWLATFVRRALARDPRLAVRSRVVTSRDVARRTRGAPASVEAMTSDVDVVLVGAPDALGARDAAALARLATRDGVALVVLADGPAATPLDALIGHGAWVSAPRSTPALVAGAHAPPASNDPGTADTIAWRGVAIGTPRMLPDGATVLARLITPDGRVGAPVLWRAPAGRGELLVSGAFDAWRLRDAAQSSFAADWPALVLELAARRVPALSAHPGALALRPGMRTTFTIEARDGQGTGDPAAAPLLVRAEPLAPDAGDARVTPSSPASPSPQIRVTPRGGGRWRVDVVAPADSGTWQLVATRGTARLAVPVVVADVWHDVDEPAPLLEAWAAAHGGRYLDASAVTTLADAVRDAQGGAAPRAPWHPMRSPWWIVPFALALAADWWLRRRRGWP